jgi:hypothetical protein
VLSVDLAIYVRCVAGGLSHISQMCFFGGLSHMSDVFLVDLAVLFISIPKDMNLSAKRTRSANCWLKKRRPGKTETETAT